MQSISQNNPDPTISEPEISITSVIYNLPEEAEFFETEFDKIIENLLSLQCAIFHRCKPTTISGDICDITGAIVDLKWGLDELFVGLIDEKEKS